MDTIAFDPHDSLRTLIAECAEVGQLLHAKDWVEGNGGNFSIRITDLVYSQRNTTFHIWNIIKLSREYSVINGDFFILKGAGKRMRDIQKNSEMVLCICKVVKDKLWVIWPNHCNFKPTSELESHLAIHNYIKEHKPNNVAILHAHPTELIALSFLKEIRDSEGLNEILIGFSPGMILHLPEGVGYSSYAVPSSDALVNSTLELIENHHLILWAKHGCIGIGETLTFCYDLIDIANKSAKIYLSIPLKNPSNLTQVEIKNTREHFGKDLHPPY